MRRDNRQRVTADPADQVLTAHPLLIQQPIITADDGTARVHASVGSNPTATANYQPERRLSYFGDGQCSSC